MNTINKVRVFLDKVLPNISATFFIVGVIAAFMGVIDRTFGLNLKTVWAEELTNFSMIASSMLLVGIGIRKGTQISVTMLEERLTGNPQKFLKVINYALITILFSIIAYYGLRSAVINRSQLTPVMQISVFYPYLIMPIASLIIIFESITGIFETMLNNSQNRQFEKKES